MKEITFKLTEDELDIVITALRLDAKRLEELAYQQNRLGYHQKEYKTKALAQSRVNIKNKLIVKTINP